MIDVTTYAADEYPRYMDCCSTGTDPAYWNDTTLMPHPTIKVSCVRCGGPTHSDRCEWCGGNPNA